MTPRTPEMTANNVGQSADGRNSPEVAQATKLRYAPSSNEKPNQTSGESNKVNQKDSVDLEDSHLGSPRSSSESKEIECSTDQLRSTRTGNEGDHARKGSSINHANTEVEKQDPTAEPPSEQPQEDGPPFSIFTTRQKKMIILSGSFIALLSPLSSQIYFPALNTIADDLGVSISQVNLTVTTYLIVQGLAPALIANLSDTLGRRPAYIICFVIYMIANLALALQNSYPALLVLRCLQSGGSSGTVALSNGLVGDTITSAERGSYIALASVAAILGPSISPVLGGVISQYAGWHWIFWFLLILAGASFVPLLMFLPETCRNVVGDGSGEKPWWNQNGVEWLRGHRRQKSKSTREEGQSKPSPSPLEKTSTHQSTNTSTSQPPKGKINFGNPLATLTVVRDPETLIFLLAVAISMVAFYGISTAAAAQFRSAYNLTDVQISLMFLPIGAGSLISTFLSGYLIDRSYASHARRLGMPVEKKRAVDLSAFPLEKARLQVAAPMYVLGVASVVAYGWAMGAVPHIAVPAVVLFFVGVSLTGVFQVLNVLVVDLHPDKPATVAAANNLVRCELGAVSSAVVLPAIEGIGSGWTFTVFGAAMAVVGGFTWWAGARGVEMRRRSREREERRRERKEEKKQRQQRRKDSKENAAEQ